MIATTGTFGLVLVCSTFAGAEQLNSMCWKELEKANRLKAGTVADDSDSECGVLRIESTSTSGTWIEVLTIDNPGVNQEAYAIRGQIRYEKMEGNSYLEMLNYFGGPGPYFSRTLADSGPSKKLRGSSPWRDFIIPFFINDGSKRTPARLDLNIQFAGRGSVWLRSVELVQFADAKSVMQGGFSPPSHKSGAWWSDKMAGLIGGIAGSILGVMGALVGTLCSLGRARRVAQATAYLMLAVGLASLSTGIIALSNGQPYSVYYPLLLVGVIGTVIPLLISRSISSRFQALDLRRMNAIDSGA